MFRLKAPSETHAGSPELKGEYKTLDEAIHAAIEADVDLAKAVIEKGGGQHSVNDWITFKIAGGCLRG